MDLSKKSSINCFVEKYQKMGFKADILINNASIYNRGEMKTTEDGFESQMAVNALSPYYLTNKLLPLLRYRR